MNIHATAVRVGEAGVLLLGPSGSGKSDLALRLIDRGAMLVADDRVVLRREGEALWADAPAVLAGRLEVRGVGILAFPAVAATVRLALILDESMPRLPERRHLSWLGIDVPALILPPFGASAVLRAEAAVGLVLRDRLWSHDD
ncbi:HPr kinase/phosphorylase [Sandaracinobacteroides saxicola]|uniref:HPr kinase/phosphorylase C-terminal domain-containing protein n=1 Tax=Sandaracinobacteroides saxicola TaxID=2759707 RepID=A0A7G5IJ84_9SPHN|nr:hypothetical protein [Sandaracinobacteroides saxicola]QMW23426.1 hypothetical protein H3309_02675 [Sandaracinobacteroides saxicola]